MIARGRNWIALLLLAGLFVATVLALSLGTLPPADYTFVNGTELKTLDPHAMAGVPEGRIAWALFEGLCNWHPQTLEPQPGVAESWEISDDKRTYTFHLRDNAVWTDGSPVTADDFVWSWRRLLHPGIASEYSYEMWYAVNAEKFSKGTVDVGDQVEIELIDRPPGALPYAAGEIIRGKLIAIEDPPSGEDEKTYAVEIDGQKRRFRKGGGNGLEDYRWLLVDFETVGIKAPDPRTLVVQLTQPVPYFLYLAGYYPMAPLNRRCLETHGSPGWTKPGNIVSNGAFSLHSRRIRDRVRMVKSDTYWDRDNVKLNTVDALAVAQDTTGLNMYMTGQVDYTEYVPVTAVPTLRALKRPDFEVYPYYGTYFYRLNLTRAPLNDVRVRRALTLAVDKQAIVDGVTRAGQIPARSIVPPFIDRYMPYHSALCGEYNVAEARRLLAEAGYPGGEGFPKLEILFNTLETHEAVAQVIQAQWKQNLGIDIRLQQQEWGAYQSATRRFDYDIARYAWIGDYPDPATFLKLLTTDSPNNQTGWSNAEYDRLIAAAAEEPDTAKRLQYFHDAERVLMDELPIIPIYFYVATDLYGPYVKGLYANMQNIHPLKSIYIDHEEKARFNRLRPTQTGAPSL